MRADAGFFSYGMLEAIGAHKARYSITVAQNAQIKAAIAAIDDDWASIEYTRGGEAQVAESTITAGRRGDKLPGRDGEPAKLRLVIRRSRLLGAQRELWPNWRHHAFVTDRDDLDTCAADAYHRGHATVELAIRDLKEGSGLSRCPSGRFFANGAWLACCVLAHNLARWTARLGGAHPTRQLTVAATIRNRLLTVPGRLVNHSRRHKLRLPLNWRWANTFITALGHIRITHNGVLSLGAGLTQSATGPSGALGRICRPALGEGARTDRSGGRDPIGALTGCTVSVLSAVPAGGA